MGENSESVMEKLRSNLDENSQKLEDIHKLCRSFEEKDVEQVLKRLETKLGSQSRQLHRLNIVNQAESDHIRTDTHDSAQWCITLLKHNIEDSTDNLLEGQRKLGKRINAALNKTMDSLDSHEYANRRRIETNFKNVGKKLEVDGK